MARLEMSHMEMEARKLILRYHYVLSQLGNIWTGSTVEFPDVIATGSNPEKCVRAIQDETADAILKLKERGGKAPEPKTEWKKAFVKVKIEDKIVSDRALPK